MIKNIFSYFGAFVFLIIVQLAIQNCGGKPEQPTKEVYRERMMKDTVSIEVVPQSSSFAQFDFYNPTNGHGYQYHEETRNGMKYGIWSKAKGTSQTGYAIYVVNLTKDELEVKLLQIELNKYAH